VNELFTGKLMSIVLRSKNLTAFILLVIACNFMFGQNDRLIDSLQHVIRGDGHDSTKSMAYFRMSQYYLTNNPKEALKNLNQSISIFSSYNKSFPLIRYLTKITLCRNLAMIDSAVYYSEKVVEHCLRNKLFRQLSMAYGEMGLIEISKGNFNQAIVYFGKQIKLINDNKTIGISEAHVYNNMGIAYASKGDLDIATEYFKRGLQDEIKSNNFSNLGNVYTNIGIIYHMQGNLDSASRYYDTGLKYRNKFNDLIGICGSLNNLAVLEKDYKNHKKAISMADSALRLAQRNGYRKLEQEIYDTYTNIYVDMNDYKNAFEYNKKFNEIKSFFSNERNKSRIGELEKNLELEQKNTQLLEKDLELEKTEKQKQRQVAILFISFVFIIGLGLFLYSFSKNNKKLKELNSTISLQKNLIEEKHKDIKDSIAYAHRIQSSLIPNEASIKKQFNNVSVLFKPRDVVSGDFYWYAKKSSKHVFALADCTGHGVPGAFMSIIGINYLQTIVNEKGVLNPAEVLSLLRKGVVQSLNTTSVETDKKDGMDIALIVFDEHTLEFAGANQSLYILRSGELMEFKGDKQPVGLSDKMDNFTVQKIELQNNDRVVLFSDGLPDQFGGTEGKKLKSRAVKNWLIETVKETRDAQLEIINSRLDIHMKDYEQTDDITFVLIEPA